MVTKRVMEKEMRKGRVMGKEMSGKVMEKVTKRAKVMGKEKTANVIIAARKGTWPEIAGPLKVRKERAKELMKLVANKLMQTRLKKSALVECG